MRLFAIYKVLRCCGVQNVSENKVSPTDRATDKNIKKDISLSTTNNNNNNNNNDITGDNNHDENNFNESEEEVHKFKLFFGQKKEEAAKNNLRFEKVISGIKGSEYKNMSELKNIIKIQAKSLLRFFSLFVLYAVVGGLMFFYVEECAGLPNAGDRSIPQLGDVNKPVKFRNLTASCWRLYEKLFNTSATPSLNTSFDDFSVFCEATIQDSASPFVIEGRKTVCSWDEFKLLQYAEYTIFTLLTIGYGNTTPITTVGRMLAILYSIIGVPIAVTMYSVAGTLLVQCLTLIVKCGSRKLLKKNYPKKTVKIQVFVASVVCMILIMLIGCSITTREEMESWEFSSSLYFWFISLTTIGYGDLHFDRNRHLANIHFLLISASLLLFGLGMVAAVIESFAVALEKQSLDDNEDDDFCGILTDKHKAGSLVMSTVTLGGGLLLSTSNGDGKDEEEEDEEEEGVEAVEQIEDQNRQQHLEQSKLQEEEVTSDKKSKKKTVTFEYSVIRQGIRKKSIDLYCSL